jgi:hypothetical protein
MPLLTVWFRLSQGVIRKLKCCADQTIVNDIRYKNKVNILFCSSQLISLIADAAIGPKATWSPF